MLPAEIGDALFTKTQQRVLSLLYGKPDKSFYTNEIVRWADMGRGTVKRELDRLVSAGLLVVSREGNQLHYQANSENPIYAELVGIVRKTFGVADVLAEALAPIKDDIDIAFVYGSIAKGADTAKSDIDLFVASDTISYTELFERLKTTEETLGRIVNPTVYDIQQIRKRLKEKNAFLTRIMDQPKIWVKGSDDDLKAFRKSR